MVALACYGSDDQRDLDRLGTGGERGGLPGEGDDVRERAVEVGQSGFCAPERVGYCGARGKGVTE